MATLKGKKIVIIGGTSGIGYSIAKGSLISLAEHVVVASSSKSKVDAAVSQLLAEPELQQLDNLKGRVAGYPLDLTNSKAIGPFFETVGEIDHLIITSGVIADMVKFKEADLDEYRREYEW